MIVEIQNKRTKAKLKINEKLADYLVKKEPHKFRKIVAKKGKATYKTKDMVAE